MTCASRRRYAILLSRPRTFELLGFIEKLTPRQRPTLMLTDWRSK
jgi:hypothetical protein